MWSPILCFIHLLLKNIASVEKDKRELINYVRYVGKSWMPLLTQSKRCYNVDTAFAQIAFKCGCKLGKITVLIVGKLLINQNFYTVKKRKKKEGKKKKKKKK